jgi:hypothetical protein
MPEDTNKASRAGGAILAFSILLGSVIGIKFGQSSIGFIVGTLTGIAITIGLFILDRRS